ncbi:hypothetical protein [Bacillus sp. Brlt_9]|uniref:hypothetical protein n=1 Tax=Bacillus sp. Brlt_9 TaxID=3110916 RepID=UPI003F7C5867
MIKLAVGKTKSGKVKLIKDELQSMNKPIIILDYKNEFDDVGTNTLNIGLIDPFLSPMDYTDTIAINAGLIEYSQFLATRSTEVLKDTAGMDHWKNFKMKDLVEEALKRAANGWNANENGKVKELRRFLNFKKSKQENVLEDEINKIKENDIVIVKTEGLHSIQTRVLTFLLLNRLQQKFPSLTVVSANINYLWRDGHLFLFSKIFDFAKHDIFLSFNKTENFPKRLKEYIDSSYIFRLESNADIEFFEELGAPVDAKTKKLKTGAYLYYQTNEQEISA